MFLKLGESFQITEANLQTAESALSDPEINERFKKFAGELKKIAPKANDFLYFSAIMMHSAEASLINSDGTPKKRRDGKLLEAHWDVKGDSCKWITNDPTCYPMKNSNGDIFPESELLKAHKKWVGKPLCIDHKSSSVDFIRGVIVDTYYDRAHKRVIALCALDKINYPDLARKVSSGYATSVSMGTAVGKAVCYDCGNVARTEQDFCNHMRTKSSYGEINLDLQPIELSIVVNGADPLAKIKNVIASANHLNDYASSKRQEVMNLDGADNNKISQIKEEIISGIEKGLSNLVAQFDAAELKLKTSDQPSLEGSDTESDSALESAASQKMIDTYNNNDVLIQTFNGLKSSIEQKLSNIQEDFNKIIKLNDDSREMKMEKKSYFQGGGGSNEPAPKAVKYDIDPEVNDLREHQDRQMVGQMDTGPVDGMHPGPESVGMKEIDRKKMLLRAETEERAERRKNALVQAKAKLLNKKEAYFQGGGDGNEPDPKKVKYVKEDYDNVRSKEDRQMKGQAPFPGVGKVDELHPSPESVAQKSELARKEMLQRASFKAKFIKSAKSDGAEDRGNSQWQVFADDKLVLTASVNELTGGRVDALYNTIATRDFGTKMLVKIKEIGFE